MKTTPIPLDTILAYRGYRAALAEWKRMTFPAGSDVRVIGASINGTVADEIDSPPDKLAVHDGQITLWHPIENCRPV